MNYYEACTEIRGFQWAAWADAPPPPALDDPPALEAAIEWAADQELGLTDELRTLRLMADDDDDEALDDDEDYLIADADRRALRQLKIALRVVVRHIHQSERESLSAWNAGRPIIVPDDPSVFTPRPAPKC